MEIKAQYITRQTNKYDCWRDMLDRARHDNQILTVIALALVDIAESQAYQTGRYLPDLGRSATDDDTPNLRDIADHIDPCVTE